MGDVDEGGVDPLAQLDYLGAHLDLRSFASRLDSGSSMRKTSARGRWRGRWRHAASGRRKAPGLTVEVLGDVQDLGGLADLFVYGLLSTFLSLSENAMFSQTVMWGYRA